MPAAGSIVYMVPSLLRSLRSLASGDELLLAGVVEEAYHGDVVSVQQRLAQLRLRNSLRRDLTVMLACSQIEKSSTHYSVTSFSTMSVVSFAPGSRLEDTH